MKVKFLRCKGLFVAIAMSITGNALAQTITLNLSDCPKDTLPGGYWKETYNDSINTLTCGDFVFSHLPAGIGASFGKTYWDGFTYAINGDATNYGASGTSANWISHQWGCMAGGGIETVSGTTVTSVNKTKPYLIAYWGYHMESEWWHMHFGNIPPDSMHCLTVTLADNAIFSPQGVFICNHPWPYYGNQYGDGFARPLNQEGDYFQLIIHGIKENGQEVALPYTFAEYDENEPNSVYESPNWEWVDLAPLGDSISTIYFTMKTTDADSFWGPNTAVYFCLDKLEVEKTGVLTSLNTTTQRTVKRSALKSSKKPEATSIVYPQVFSNSLTVNSPNGGEVLIYNSNGKAVVRTNVKAGGDNIDVSKLSAGKYLFQHGQKNIYLIKK